MTSSSASNTKNVALSFKPLEANPYQSTATYIRAVACHKDAYALVYQAAHILANHEQQTGTQIREIYMARLRAYEGIENAS